MRRRDVAARIAELVGNGLLEITDSQEGWPALATLAVNGNHVPVSVFAGPVTRSNRGRDEYERRFQNPGQNRPIIIDPRRYPLLIGLLEDDQPLGIGRPLLALADPVRRAGRTTRYSVFVSVASLLEASTKGWSEDRSASGEIVRCFIAQLLPVVVSALLDDAIPPSTALQAAIEGSGLVQAPDTEIPAAAERARRAATTLVRDARFARRVIAAYDGRCAMCGLDADLIQAAHIYPASAPGSQDEPWNGIALCPNHHLAFDRHLLAVLPGTREIIFSPVIHSQVRDVRAMRAFVEGTFARLAEPDDTAARPATQMFSDRYVYFAEGYTWMDRHPAWRR